MHSLYTPFRLSDLYRLLKPKIERSRDITDADSRQLLEPRQTERPTLPEFCGDDNVSPVL